MYVSGLKTEHYAGTIIEEIISIEMTSTLSPG